MFLLDTEVVIYHLNGAQLARQFIARLMNNPVHISTVRAAQIRRSLRTQYRSARARQLDIMIAATALEHGLTLATNNEAGYRDIPGLLIETP